MNGKRLLIGTCGALLAGAVAYGVWVAWDTGLIPGNPRAPTIEAMTPVAREAALMQARKRGALCAAPDPGVRPQLKAIPGVAPHTAPGQFGVAFALDDGSLDTPQRQRVIQQYGALAKVGYLEASDIEVATDAGRRPGKMFTLTRQGYASLASPDDLELCFAVGDYEVGGIKEIKKLPDDAQKGVWYEARLDVSVTGVPDWIKEPEVQSLFPRLAELVKPTEMRVRLLRADSGWVSEARHQVQSQAGSPAEAEKYWQRLAAPPKLDAPAAKALLGEYVARQKWLGPGTNVCLQLLLQPGGDDRNTVLAAHTFSGTFFDVPLVKRQRHEILDLFTQLHLYAALEGAKLAVLEKTGPAIFGGEPVAGGVRYSLVPQAVEGFRAQQGARCIPAGQMGAVELLGVHPDGYNGVRIRAKAALTGTLEWVKPIAGSLPALKGLLSEGVYFTGHASYGTEVPKKWTVDSLHQVVAKVEATELPEVLRPLLPRTAGLEVPTPQAAQAVKPARASSAKSHRIPFPAGNADVHVVSIYEGIPFTSQPGIGGERRRFWTRASVTPSAAPVMLLLVAYEPTEWRVTVEPGAKVQRILALGHYDQSVKVTGAEGIDVDTRTHADLLGPLGIDYMKAFPYQPASGDPRELASAVKAITGKAPATYQASRRGRNVFRIGTASQ